ncbi:hypothetical protein [Helicobacter pylori]|uniref:hypothetical protein n=1 Tax=Helicobacter pylori TaxID=210 RepID=UPI002D1E44F4|nr:hypothetical protein [Helicobacter pylori]
MSLSKAFFISKIILVMQALCMGLEMRLIKKHLSAFASLKDAQILEIIILSLLKYLKHRLLA